MCGTPQRSRSTVTGFSSPGTCSVPSIRETAALARPCESCARVCRPTSSAIATEATKNAGTLIVRLAWLTCTPGKAAGGTLREGATSCQDEAVSYEAVQANLRHSLTVAKPL